jgi:hypothetical protein
VTVRIGILVFALIILINHVKDLKYSLEQPKTIFYAAIKEPFAIAAVILALYATFLGPLSVVRSIASAESAIVLIGSFFLVKLGLIDGGIKRKEIIQKSVGVILIISGSVLLFL